MDGEPIRLDRMDRIGMLASAVAGGLLAWSVTTFIELPSLGLVIGAALTTMLALSIIGIAMIRIFVQRRPWALAATFMPWNLVFIAGVGIYGLSDRGVIAGMQGVSMGAMVFAILGVGLGWWAHKDGIRRASSAT